MTRGRCGRPRGEPVVAAVLGATLDELGRVGYAALLVEEVAARAGVNKTTVYRRWETKAGLVRAAVQAAADAVADLQETGDVRADLLAIARRARDYMSSPRGRGVLRMLLAGSLDPDLSEIATAARRQVEAPARRILERAIERGALRAGVDPGLVLEVLGGWILHVLFRQGAAVRDARLRALVDLVLAGVLAPAPPRPRCGSTAADRVRPAGQPPAAGGMG